MKERLGIEEVLLYNNFLFSFFSWYCITIVNVELPLLLTRPSLTLTRSWTRGWRRRMSIRMVIFHSRSSSSPLSGQPWSTPRTCSSPPSLSIPYNKHSTYWFDQYLLTNYRQHGLINYIDIIEKCRDLKIFTFKGTLRQEFIRVYRPEKYSVMLVFST